MTLKILGLIVFIITASHWLIDATGFVDPPIYRIEGGPR